MEETGTKKLIRSKSGFRMVTVDEEKKSPLLINEPLWTPDKEASNCTNCSAKFGFTTRKHHCRRCGLIYCKKCCENMIELPRMSFIDPVRVCLNCEEETRSENKFFQHDLKILTLGAFFILNNKNLSDLLLRCKLSQDHRTLVFEGSKITPIYLEEITNLCVERDEKGKMNLDLFYIEDGQKEKMTFATTKDAQERKTGTNWIKAIQQLNNKAYTLANERYAKPNWDRNSSAPLLR